MNCSTALRSQSCHIPIFLEQLDLIGALTHQEKEDGIYQSLRGGVCTSGLVALPPRAHFIGGGSCLLGTQAT